MILGHTMGSTTNDANSLVNNIHSSDPSYVLWTMVGGAIFNLANLLLVAAIAMAGLAVAFPLSIGIALVCRSCVELHPAANRQPALLAGGVLCALIAVIMIGKAYGSLVSAGKSVSRKSVITCIVSGVLMGLWAPSWPAR